MERQKKTSAPWAAYLSILTAAALWGIIGTWNRTLMAAGLSPTSIVVVRNFGGMLLLLAGLGVYALDLPGMIAPLSEMFEMQFEAFQGEMMMKLLIKGGTALLGGQILAGMSLWMMRRMERKQAA